MKRYRVFGRMYQDYYLIQSASDEHEAIDLANQRPQNEWFAIKTDDVIEATDVYLDEEIQINKDNIEIQLNEDNYDLPQMESGIIVRE